MGEPQALFDHGSQADRIARQVMSTDEAEAVAQVYEAARVFVSDIGVDDAGRPSRHWVTLRVGRKQAQRLAGAVGRALGYVG